MSSLAGGTPSLGTGGLGIGTGISLPQPALGAGALQLGGGLGANFSTGQGVSAAPAPLPGPSQLGGLPSGGMLGVKPPTLQPGGVGGGLSLKPPSGPGAPATGLLLSAPTSQPPGAPATGLLLSAPTSQPPGSMAAAVAGGTPMGGGLQLPKPQLTSQPTLTLRPTSQTAATAAAPRPALATTGLQLPSSGITTTLGKKLVLCICVYNRLCFYMTLCVYTVGLLSIRVDLAASKITITSAKNVGFLHFMYPLTAL